MLITGPESAAEERYNIVTDACEHEKPQLSLSKQMSGLVVAKEVFEELRKADKVVLKPFV